MRALSTFPRILLFQGHLDFRKRRRSTAAYVQAELAENPFSETAFVFLSRRKDTIRILYWDGNGFALWEKGLEEDVFAWPKSRTQESVVITAEQAEWLLRGIDIFSLKEHKPRPYLFV